MVVGGVAARLHGSDQLTTDLDVAPDRSDENLDRLLSALGELGAVRVTEPGDRSAPEAPLFRRRIEQFVCPIGNIDVLAEVHRVGGFERLVVTAEPVDLDGDVTVLIADLDSLIWSKSGTGRDKDAVHVRSLERLRDELRSD